MDCRVFLFLVINDHNFRRRRCFGMFIQNFASCYTAVFRPYHSWETNLYVCTKLSRSQYKYTFSWYNVELFSQKYAFQYKTTRYILVYYTSSVCHKPWLGIWNINCPLPSMIIVSGIHMRTIPVTKINSKNQIYSYFSWSNSAQKGLSHIFTSFPATTQRDLTITVGYRNSTNANDICRFYAGPMTSGETRRLICDNPIFGHFVFIQRTGNVTAKSLALCEVKVFGYGEQIFLPIKVQSHWTKPNWISNCVKYLAIWFYYHLE